MAVKDDILQKALDLSPEDRVELAYKLLESVEGVEGDDEGADPEDVEEEWGEELERRLDDLRSGRVKGLTFEEVKREMEAHLKGLRTAARRSRSSPTRKRSKK